MIVLDHIKSLELNDTEASKHYNELRSLNYLSQGLWFLYRQVEIYEDVIKEKANPSRITLIWGNHPELQEIPQDLIACAFHWYSVSVCNYVKLIGWLVNDNDSTKARRYMKEVLPEVYLWRNKVGAHFSRIVSREDDNAADLAKSVMFPIIIDDNVFSTNSLTLTLGSNPSRKDMNWSLTAIHRKLILRYWPQQNTHKQVKKKTGLCKSIKKLLKE